MKKIQGIVAALFVTLALPACGSGGSDKETGLGESREALVPTKIAPQTSLNGYVRADQVSAVVYDTNALPSHIVELARVSGTWVRSDLTAMTGAVPATPFYSSAYVRADGLSDVVYRSEDGHIREFARVGGSWVTGDLTAATGAGLCARPPHAYVRSDNVSAIVYLGTDNHVRELRLAPGGAWIATDLTAAAHAPAGASGSDAFGYVRGDGVTAVIYLTPDGHLHELSLMGGTWSVGDLTAAAGAQLAVFNGRPYKRSDGASSVVFITSDKHVREIALVGGVWKTFDLSAVTLAPLAAVGYAAIPYVRSDGRSAVIYPSVDRHVRELSMSPSGVWSVGDLTAASGAPVDFAFTAGAYVRSDLVNAVVYYDSNAHVHELSLPQSGGAWTHLDLNTIAGGP